MDNTQKAHHNTPQHTAHQNTQHNTQHATALNTTHHNKRHSTPQQDTQHNINESYELTHFLVCTTQAQELPSYVLDLSV